MIKLIKLSTGEEVVASVKKNSETKTTELKNAARIIYVNQGASLLPLCLLSKGDTVVVNDMHIVYETDVEDELLNGYNAQFGSGIVLANAGDLKLT